jgi:hypothetical protein
MKKNRKYTASGGKVSETLLMLMDNIKKLVANGQAKKAGALLALLFAGNVAKGFAEEVMGTILFPPTEKHSSAIGLFYEYEIDTTGNSVADRRYVAMQSEINKDLIFNTLTKYYLAPGTKFIFENKELKPFEEVAINRTISIEINGQMVELTEMFPLDLIKWRLPYLYAKLVREGRAR